MCGWEFGDEGQTIKSVCGCAFTWWMHTTQLASTRSGGAAEIV
jgi:hypothetical protein